MAAKRSRGGCWTLQARHDSGLFLMTHACITVEFWDRASALERGDPLLQEGKTGSAFCPNSGARAIKLIFILAKCVYVRGKVLEKNNSNFMTDFC